MVVLKTLVAIFVSSFGNEDVRRKQRLGIWQGGARTNGDDEEEQQPVK